MPSRYESLVSASRPNDAHGIALQLVGTGKRVLELGAAAGHVTKELVARGNSVTAVEVDETLRSELENIASRVVIADLDQVDLLSHLPGEQFDVVLAGDVLEHTIHTRLILEEIRQLLRPGGYVVISVPNVAHGDVRLALLNGEFRYREVGILDRTHRTFFTRDTLIEFLEENGFENLEIFSSSTPLGTTEIKPNVTDMPEDVIKHVLDDPLSAVYQFIVKAYPSSAAGTHPEFNLTSTERADAGLAVFESALASRGATIAALKAKSEEASMVVQRVEDKLDHVQEQTSQIRAELGVLAEQIHKSNSAEDLALRDYALGVLAELGETRARLQEITSSLTTTQSQLSASTSLLAQEMTRAYEAEKQVMALADQLHVLRNKERELLEIRASTTWRVGRFFMLPVRAIRRLLRR